MPQVPVWFRLFASILSVRLEWKNAMGEKNNSCICNNVFSSKRFYANKQCLEANVIWILTYIKVILIFFSFFFNYLTTIYWRELNENRIIHCYIACKSFCLFCFSFFFPLRRAESLNFADICKSTNAKQRKELLCDYELSKSGYKWSEHCLYLELVFTIQTFFTQLSMMYCALKEQKKMTHFPSTQQFIYFVRSTGNRSPYFSLVFPKKTGIIGMNFEPHFNFLILIFYEIFICVCVCIFYNSFQIFQPTPDCSFNYLTSLCHDSSSFFFANVSTRIIPLKTY